jgi:flagellar biosynthesis/type III secretory pathway protein FliH
MASILSNRPNPVSLPRISLAAIALALALACVVASVVGIAAWTIRSGPGITQADVVAAQKAAYGNGHDAGYHDGLVKGREGGHTAGYRQGRIDGFRAGRQRGLANGFRKGHDAGYTEGYAAGQAAAAAAQAAKKTTGTQTTTH